VYNDVESDHNLFNREQAGMFGNTWDTIASMTPNEDHSVIGDPLFVDPDNGDYRLREGSPAIDAGVDVGLPYLGDAPDIGAFEHQG
jgi:hypothetical protein